MKSSLAHQVGTFLLVCLAFTSVSAGDPVLVEIFELGNGQTWPTVQDQPTDPVIPRGNPARSGRS